MTYTASTSLALNRTDERYVSGSVTKEEWMGFWKNVLKHGYPEEDLLEEVDMLKEGGSWVDYNDGRTT